MRIIIDGCDKSGKSTLIEALKNEIPSLIGLKLLTKPKDASEQAKQYVKAMYIHMADMTRDQKAHYLFDRWYPSEMVYSFKRGYNALEDGWFWAFEQELRKTPNLYVLLHVDPELVKARFESEGEAFAKTGEITKIQRRYQEHFKKCQLNKIMVDPTDKIGETVELIKATIKDILEIKTVDYTEK